MFHWRTILFGLTFGILDSIALPIVKGVSTGWNKAWMAVPMTIYAFTPLILLQALSGETLTIMNLVWDLTSDLLVTFIGLFIFMEKISPVRMVGVCLSFVSLSLMAYEGDGWNDYIRTNVGRVQKFIGGFTQGH